MPGIVADPVVPLAVFALGVAAIGLAHRVGPPRRGAGVLATLGRATYPLYLLNQVVGAAVIVALVRVGLSGWMAVGVAAGVVLGDGDRDRDLCRTGGADGWLAAFALRRRTRQSRALWRALPRRPGLANCALASLTRLFACAVPLAPDTPPTAFPPAG